MMVFPQTVGNRSRVVKNTYSGRKRLILSSPHGSPRESVSVSALQDHSGDPISSSRLPASCSTSPEVLKNDVSTQGNFPTSPIKRRKQSKLSFISSDGHLKKANPARLVQTQLAFGSPIRETTCPDCKMTYQPTSHTDTAVHKKFHLRAVEGREWNSNWGGVVYRDSVRKQRYIVKIDPTKAPERKATEDLIELVNTELNAPRDRELWKSKQSDNGAVLVYIADNRAVGLVVVERAFVGHWMSVDTGEILDNGTFKIMLGISRIYVSKRHRLQGISTSLLNVMCCNFIYGIKIPRTQVGWSQPSATGGKVASRWAGEPIVADVNSNHTTDTGIRVRVYLETDEENMNIV